MAVYSYKGQQPQLGMGVFIAPSADIVGQISLKDNVNIWFQCVARGDINVITIGENTNIQDLSMLHVTLQHPLHIGKNVTVGHNVTLHGCTIGDHSLIGMGAVVLDGAEIGKGCVVAGGSVVPPGKKYPDYSMIMGNPAIAKRSLTPEEREIYGNHYKTYLITKDEYLDPQTIKKI